MSLATFNNSDAIDGIDDAIGDAVGDAIGEAVGDAVGDREIAPLGFRKHGILTLLSSPVYLKHQAWPLACELLFVYKVLLLLLCLSIQIPT